MSGEQPIVNEAQARLWLLDRYDNLCLPPGAIAFVIGADRRGDRPWERRPQPRRHYDDHIARGAR